MQAVVVEKFVAKGLREGDELEEKLLGAGACDTCCNRTVAGKMWIEDYLERLRQKGLPHWTTKGNEKFRFGSGDPVACSLVYFVPVTVHGGDAVLRISAVP
eukprot:12913137-Prorocentrum_lima.AAC.1